MTAEDFFRATNTLALGLPWLRRTVALVLTFLAGPVGFLVHISGRWFLVPPQTPNRPECPRRSVRGSR